MQDAAKSTVHDILLFMNGNTLSESHAKKLFSEKLRTSVTILSAHHLFLHIRRLFALLFIASLTCAMNAKRTRVAT